MSLLLEKNVALSTPSRRVEPLDELTSIRRDMLNFAKLQLRDVSLAEDAVQDAMVSAITGMKNFNKQSQLKTWVFSILKNKIIDIIRNRKRSPNTKVDVDEIAEDAYDEMFDESGDWQTDMHPTNWTTPENIYSNQEFWSIFEACLYRLPESTARIFMMREIIGFEVSEICKELDVSSTNCGVVLYRARMNLRLCLDQKWFGSKGDKHED